MVYLSSLHSSTPHSPTLKMPTSLIPRVPVHTVRMPISRQIHSQLYVSAIEAIKQIKKSLSMANLHLHNIIKIIQQHTERQGQGAKHVILLSTRHGKAEKKYVCTECLSLHSTRTYNV